MDDFFFVVKCVVATLLIVFVMQIRIGTVTLEQKSMAWVHESAVADELRAVAEGAVKVSREGYDMIAAYFPRSAVESQKKKVAKVKHSVPANIEDESQAPRD
jgi:hypothetical protein